MEIVFDNVSFSYGEKRIFHGFSLAIPHGAAVAVRGASGAGKTTLVRLAAGLERPDAGEVRGCPETVSFVFQEPRLVPSMSALDNAAIAGERTLAAEILRELGLAGEENSMPHELSGGMARRVAIARALAHKSPLLVLDEPFSGLDTAAAEMTARCISARRNGRTLLAVTHSAREAELLGADALYI